MTDDELDRVLGREQEIMPSSGFSSTVMDAVRREASATPPLPFPWKRVLPGLAGSSVIFAGFLISAVINFRRGGGTPETPVVPLLLKAMERANDYGAGWVAFALLLSFASVVFSRRLVR